MKVTRGYLQGDEQMMEEKEAEEQEGKQRWTKEGKKRKRRMRRLIEKGNSALKAS